MARTDSTLFDRPLAHRNDPLSSYQAGEHVARSGKVKGQMLTVLKAVKAYPGSTSAELARYAGLDRYTPARRLPVLERRGLVLRGPERICRVCRSSCVTWRPVESENPLFEGAKR